MKPHRRSIDKDYILFYLKNKNSDRLTALTREIKIDTIFDSEILILDSWASKFYKELNPIESEIRKSLKEKHKFSSSHSFINDDDFKNLNSLSEALISLLTEQSPWIDIHLVIEKLKLRDSIPPEDHGKYTVLRDKCIEALIGYFGK